MNKLINKQNESKEKSFDSQSHKKEKRCVVTGIGIISPIGLGKDEFFDNLLKGKTGVGSIKNFDTSNFNCKMAAQILDFDANKYLKESQIKYFSPVTKYACSAFALAGEDADLDFFDPFRTDVIIGGASSGSSAFVDGHFNLETDMDIGELDVHQSAMLKIFLNTPASAIALLSKTRGYVTTVSSACSSTIDSVGQAAERIRAGKCDIAIAGGVDAPIDATVMNAYNAAGFLTSKEDAKSIRPFSNHSDKTVIGEGAAIFILEELESAQIRNATIYGEITGFSQKNENLNATLATDLSGEDWVDTMKQALNNQTKKLKIDHINAHGSSDKILDELELKALKQVLNGKINNITINSIKGAVGSGMASAGAFQIASALLTLYKNILPPYCKFVEIISSNGQKEIRHEKLINSNVQRIMVNGHSLAGANASLIIERYKND